MQFWATREDQQGSEDEDDYRGFVKGNSFTSRSDTSYSRGNSFIRGDSFSNGGSFVRGDSFTNNDDFD